MSNRVGIVIIVLLIAHVVFSNIFKAYYSESPLDKAINLTSDFSNVYKIRVPMEQMYQVQLRFSREGKKYEYLKSIIGEMTTSEENGVPLNVEWALTNSDGVLVKESNTTAYDSCGWSKNYVFRCLGKFKVHPGRYNFSLSGKSPPEVFGDFSTHAVISYNIKNASTWHTGYIFWSGLFNSLISPVIAGLVLLVMLVSTIRRRHLTIRS